MLRVFEAAQRGSGERDIKTRRGAAAPPAFEGKSFKEIILGAQDIPLSYETKLLNRVEVAENTMAFHFEKPPGFEFSPGQSSDLTLVDPPETDSEGNVRTFSIASAPFEDRLTFATRMRDTAFKRCLKTMPIGTAVKMEPATGSFTLHKASAQPAVLLAGGIGITPFFSIAKQAAHERLPAKLFLFYSNRRPEDAPFLEPLENLEKSNPNFHLIATMSEMSRSRRKWEGETGLIDKAMLSRYVNDLRGPIFYIAGPPSMVKELRRMLLASSVSEHDIRTDEFAGY
jgi:ferredoxin-NADP reductase